LGLNKLVLKAEATDSETTATTAKILILSSEEFFVSTQQTPPMLKLQTAASNTEEIRWKCQLVRGTALR
jgi:hypothetical protein